MQQISPLLKCFLTSVTKAKTGAKYFEEVSVRLIIFYIFCETITFENKWSKEKEMSTEKLSLIVLNIFSFNKFPEFYISFEFR